jgi:hypothetical protein
MVDRMWKQQRIYACSNEREMNEGGPTEKRRLGSVCETNWCTSKRPELCSDPLWPTAPVLSTVLLLNMWNKLAVVAHRVKLQALPQVKAGYYLCEKSWYKFFELRAGICKEKKSCMLNGVASFCLLCIGIVPCLQKSSFKISCIHTYSILLYLN